MFASFFLFIKNCHTANDDHAVFNLATSAIVRKRVRPRITGTGTQIEKPGKPKTIIGCNNNHIVYYRPLTVTK